MPYIRQVDREKYAETLDALLNLLDGVPKEKKYGHINFCVTYLLKYLTYEKQTTYDDYNSIIGVLECIKQEFYRKLISVYEDVKEKENGGI